MCMQNQREGCPIPREEAARGQGCLAPDEGCALTEGALSITLCVVYMVNVSSSV